jgi:opacity protein-like surface antigen/outer membrane protease
LWRTGYIYGRDQGITLPPLTSAGVVRELVMKIPAFATGTTVLASIAWIALADPGVTIAAEFSPGAPAHKTPIYKAPPAQAPPALPIWSWTGFYVGGHVGGGRGRSSIADPYGVAIFGDHVGTPGPLAGVQAGFNYQSGVAVIGAEADLSFADMDGTNSCFAVGAHFYSANCHAHTRRLGTVAVRLGWAVAPQTLLYGKAGAAWMREHVDMLVNVNPTGLNFASGADYVQWGWTAGAGAEYALTPAWSVKLEYDYLRFGSHDVATPAAAVGNSVCTPGGCFVFLDIAGTTGAPAGISKNIHLLKLGLNYRLGAAAVDWPQMSSSNIVKAPPAPYVAGWELELGARYWYSRGRFHKDFGSGQDNPTAPTTLESRLTYDNMIAHSGEVFGRIDTPWNVFLKGFVGLGSSQSGHLNDEDWLAFPLPVGGTLIYSNTVSEVHSRIDYGVLDAGFTFFKGHGYKVGAFAGYGYFRQLMNAYGCIQLATPSTQCVPAIPTSFLGIIEDSRWKSARVGAIAELFLAPRVKLSGEAAYLPYVRYDGLDTHVRGPRFFPASGHGTGVQLETILSYFVTPELSVGVGGRYWAMWTTEGERHCDGCQGPGSSSPATTFRAAAEQAGVFVQVAYKPM